uniref:ARAD1C17798p n=1 Tax=Blastobotrys adeninivorans TaxID=409370 RepID=A0A060T709_BLAAD
MEYIDDYEGPIKIQRIVHLAKVSGNEEVVETAIKLVMKETSNVALYEDLIAYMSTLNPAKAQSLADEGWVENTEANNRKFEQSWAQGLSDLAYLSANDIAQAYKKYTEHFISTGEFKTAQRYASRSQDRGSGHLNQEIGYTLRTSWLAVLDQSWAYGRTLASKLYLSEERTDSIEYTKLGIILGVAMMATKEYANATAVFLTLDSLAGQSGPSDLASASDVGIYVALTALATLPRGQLQYMAQKDPVFTALTKGRAKWARTLVSAFVNAQYNQLFDVWAQHEQEMEADPFIHRVIKDIYAQLRTRVLHQYINVFSQVGMSQMAREFRVSEKELVRELLESQTDAVIVDYKNGVIQANKKDGLQSVVDKTKKLSQDFCTNASVVLWSLEARGPVSQGHRDHRLL